MYVEKINQLLNLHLKARPSDAMNAKRNQMKIKNLDILGYSL